MINKLQILKGKGKLNFNHYFSNHFHDMNYLRQSVNIPFEHYLFNENSQCIAMIIHDALC